MRSLEKPRELWTVSLKVRLRSFFTSFIIVVIIIISFIIVVMLGKTLWLMVMIKKNCDLNEIEMRVLCSLS